MPNAALCLNSLPAERMRGVRFAQRFWDKAALLRDAWTLVGNPPVDQGIELNGTTQYATVPLNGELNNDELTIEIEFYPDFVPDENVRRYFYSTTTLAVNYRLIKFEDAISNQLRLYGGGANRVDIALATYSPHWLVGQRNLFTAAIENGNWNVWLNGAQLVTANAQAYTPTDDAHISLGRNDAGGNYFDGKITNFKIGHYLATQQEHIDTWNHATWNWRNLLTYDFEFKTGDYDPVNSRTNDARTDVLYAVLGNGAGVGEPTQAAGYMVFDGVNDYLSGIANPAGAFTVMGMKDIGTGWEFFSHNDLTEWTPVFTSGGFTGNLAALMLAGSVLTPTQELDAERAIRTTLGHQL